MYVRKEKQKRYELDLMPPGVLLEPGETESRCIVPIIYKARKYFFVAIQHLSWNISYICAYVFSVFVVILALHAKISSSGIAREFIKLNYIRFAPYIFIHWKVCITVADLEKHCKHF